MSQKYRIKLNSGRIVGPFKKEQVGELYFKGHLSGDEQCQQFPAGDWKYVKDFKELSDLILSIIEKKITLEDLVESRHSSTLLKIDLNKLKKSKAQGPTKGETSKEGDGFHEFKFSTATNEEDVNYDELEKKYQKKEKEKEEQERLKREEEAKKLEATRIIKRPDLGNVEKTVIINPQEDLQPPPTPVEEEEEKEEANSSVEKEQSENQLENINFEEKTEFINVGEFLPELKGMTSEAESEFEKKLREETGEDDIESEETEEKQSEDENSDKNKKKRIKPIVAIAFLVVIWFLLEDSAPEPRDPRSINIEFPVVNDISNQTEARNAYERGRILYDKGDYVSKLLAASEFSESLSHQFQENPSLGYLILTYAELFPNATDKQRGGSTLFRLIKIGQSRVLTDANVALGTAIFYLNNGKYQTAVNTIENFLRVSGGNSRIFAVYLESLIKVGRLDQAGQVAERLRGVERKSPYVYLALNEFEKVNQNFDRAEEIISEGLERDPHQVPLLIELAEFQVRNGNHERFALIIELIDELDAERSPVYFAKLLEFKGILSAMKGDNNEAANFFRVALTIHESDELRSKLAALSLGGDEAVEALILESRVVDLMKRAERAMEQHEWEDAFVYAIEATDLLETHIGARVLLSKIQIERGFFEGAISALRGLLIDHPLNITINYYYGIALIEANKLHQANQHISLMDQRLHDTSEFAELLARYYEKRNEVSLAVRWYNESLKRNPLNDENYFRLSQIFTRNRNYDRAKNNLLEAITLNPSNVYYRSAYAEILYDLDGASTAIGYLNEALDTNPDHPKLIGDIAIFYYRNGQIRDYERYKEKLENLNTRDPSFYEFKVRSAQLGNRIEEVVKYAHELSRVNPGDMDTRLMLANFLIRLHRHSEAEVVLNEILDRLESYPKANYHLAQIYLYRGDIELAMEHAEKEIEFNPELEQGYFVKAKAHEAREEYTEAIRNYERAISLSVNYVDALMGLANIKHRQNFYAEARELYHRARRQEQNNPRIWRQLGFVYRASGQSILAAEAFETYLRLDPGTSERERIQSLINQLR